MNVVLILEVRCTVDGAGLFLNGVHVHREPLLRSSILESKRARSSSVQILLNVILFDLFISFDVS